MAYFDSAKNRALWQKELDGLRKERARREASGFSSAAKKKEDGMSDNPQRIRITYAQLEREEYETVRNRNDVLRERQREKSAEHSAKEKPALEASV